jgi:ankyrin repeat protein
MDDWYERERLHRAAQDGDLELVQSLVRMGEPLNAFDDLARTPLHYAVASDHDDVVAFLIRSGADVNAHDESQIGETPLGRSAETISLTMAKLLIDCGADPTIPGWMQLTALHRAERRARKGNADEDAKAVLELLQHAARKKDA